MLTIPVDLCPGRVPLLLRDLAPPASPEPYEAGALPLLAHAFAGHVERGSRGRLTLADHHATGGIRGAVAHIADAVIDSMSASDREHRDPGMGADARGVGEARAGPPVPASLPRQVATAEPARSTTAVHLPRLAGGARR